MERYQSQIQNEERALFDTIDKRWGVVFLPTLIPLGWSAYMAGVLQAS
jgi:hypothetical protein